MYPLLNDGLLKRSAIVPPDIGAFFAFKEFGLRLIACPGLDCPEIGLGMRALRALRVYKGHWLNLPVNYRHLFRLGIKLLAYPRFSLVHL